MMMVPPQNRTKWRRKGKDKLCGKARLCRGFCWCLTGMSLRLIDGNNPGNKMIEITRILDSVERGGTQAADQLLPAVYEELRKLAAQKMAHEAAGHTLQPTALVHEAWLRLAGAGNQRWEGRGHFFAAAAEAMRRVLIEKARSKQALKRGGDFERVNLDDVDVAALADGETLLLINDALEQLEKEDPAAAQVVKLRFFAGMTNDEAGEALGISARTAKRCWTFARAWLFQQLHGAPKSGS